MTKPPYAIKVEAVAKNFLLPHERVSSIKKAFTNIFRRRKRTVEVQHALRHIEFEVKPGEFFGIVGKNGSGKSTLLKILAGIYQPSRGKVTTIGSLVPFIELGVGFNPELTGRENVYLNGALLGFSRAQIDAKYKSIVKFAELEDFMDQQLKNYSSGMQVRLAFSMAVQAESDILILDEVLAVGDAAFQRKCFNYFMSLKKRKKTVVLVTHDMEAVRQYCDRAILIKEGEITAEGDPEEVAQEYMKQFMSEEQKQEDSDSPFDKDENRWGTGELRFGTPKIKVTDDFVIIETKVTANADIAKPLYGFSVANSAGQRLMGTNNQLCRVPAKSLKNGEQITVTWKIPNVFVSGDYKVDLASEKVGGAATLDWWNEAGTFTVQKAHPTPYVVYPHYEVSIEHA